MGNTGFAPGHAPSHKPITHSPAPSPGTFNFSYQFHKSEISYLSPARPLNSSRPPLSIFHCPLSVHLTLSLYHLLISTSSNQHIKSAHPQISTSSNLHISTSSQCNSLKFFEFWYINSSAFSTILLDPINNGVRW